MLNPYQLHLLEPWTPPQEALPRWQHSLDGGVRAALMCDHSLTRHLEAYWQTPVTVTLEGHQWLQGEAARQLLADAPHPWHHFQLAGEESLLLRDAWLAAGGANRIYAHSRLILDGLSTGLRQAIEQGERPLGDLFLQSEDSLSRQGLLITLAQHSLLAKRLNLPAHHPFWCRHSRLQVGSRVRADILEIFL